MKKLFDTIDNLADEYLEFLIQMCNIESKSEDKEAVDAVCSLILAKAREKGYEIIEKKIEKAGNVAAIILNPDAKGNPVCISAHMDTVFKKGEFGYPVCHIKDGILYGPGVIDCKGGIAVGMLALEALKSIGYDKRPVKMILQSDEEVQSLYSNKETINFMVEQSKNADAFFNCEYRTKGKITTKRKGIIRARIDIKGRAAHAGDYFEGISAIREASHKIIELENLSIKDGITYNCGIVNGGTAMNVRPEKCSIFIDVRIANIDEFNEAISNLRAITEKSYVTGTKSELTIMSDRKPMERTQKNEQLFEHIKKISEKYGFGTQEQGASNGGSDAAYTTIAGVPSVDDIGPIGGKYHSKDEWCDISSIAESAKLISASIIALEPFQERVLRTPKVNVLSTEE